MACHAADETEDDTLRAHACGDPSSVRGAGPPAASLAFLRDQNAIAARRYSVRPRYTAAGHSLSLTGQITLKSLYFGRDRVADSCTHVSFQHYADPRGLCRHYIYGFLHYRHYFVPFTFDYGEHRVSVVRQAALTHHADSVRHDFANAFSDTQRCH